jgi:hypothetical protein
MEEWFTLQEHPDDHMLYVRDKMTAKKGLRDLLKAPGETR